MKFPSKFVVGLIVSLAIAPCFISSISAQIPGPHFGTWSAPEPVAVLNTTLNELPTGVSHDGLRLYFNRAPGDIFVSHRQSRDADREEPVALAFPINTMAIDANAFESIDGHWLYFSSTRPGGVGGSDIWVSWRKFVHDDTAWQEPVNLTAVNSVGFEGGPALYEDDMTGLTYLYLAAAPYAGGTQALSDIYVSTLGPGGFSTPIPVSELNVSTHHDGKPTMRRDGLEIIFESYRQSVIGPFNPPGAIYASTRFSTDEPWSAPVIVINAAPAGQPGDWYVTTPVLSRDAMELYVGVNQPGTEPGDIYVSYREKIRGRR